METNGISRKIAPYFDPAGEYEPANTIYTLTVRCPPRPPPKWLPDFVTREPYKPKNVGATYTIKPDNYGKPNYDYFTVSEMNSMRVKTVTLKSWQFPPELRCAHVQISKTCDRGCYILEKGGDHCRWRCRREGCQGHVFDRNVLTDGNGVACFGEKGKRMVCSDRLPK
ncbi:hypothetical protein FB567DRAFT_551754 [Paraphoma chrysanthemicola]|uniref:Uncharacterized protein n=1 Tax=Paraphoma chrysanthemicola TaxID=798071 RepID=A0A8K0R059_9PLEO|nr:hypothetical protein FB567DRAFT_551754 [Paraphoma chrysanthemicola]